MGICYSSISVRSREKEWKSKNDDSNLDLKLRKANSGSNDFASFISKLGVGGGGAAAAAAARERALHQIPGRLCANGASSVACLHTQQGRKGTNQDAMIVWEKFGSRKDAIFCGVFDGHGPYGHMVARKVRDTLPLLLLTGWESRYDTVETCNSEDGNANGNMHFDEILEDDCGEPTENQGIEKFPDSHLPLKESILKAFKLMDKELKLHPTIDCFCSGTTAVTFVMKGQDLIIGNVGDSRAVLATRDKENALTAVQLTVDLKPNLPREAARIQKYKGRVFSLQDEPEVARVWLPNSDSPGLAMARAFGDFCLKDFGLISIPDIYYHRIAEGDEFVVLATDGVWDVLSNKEAVDVVASAPSRSTAARALVDCVTRAWRLKYPTSKNDDCAVVCLFLDDVASSNVTEAQNGLCNDSEEEKAILSTANLTQDQNGLGTDPEEEKAIISTTNVTQDQNGLCKDPEEEKAKISTTNLRQAQNGLDEDHEGDTTTIATSADSMIYDVNDVSASHTRSTTESCEIEPVLESTEEKLPEKSLGRSKRSLAECLSVAEDEEWSALEGITRVNSLLSLPRFLSMDKRSTSWRKWL